MRKVWNKKFFPSCLIIIFATRSSPERALVFFQWLSSTLSARNNAEASSKALSFASFYKGELLNFLPFHELFLHVNVQPPRCALVESKIQRVGAEISAFLIIRIISLSVFPQFHVEQFFLVEFFWKLFATSYLWISLRTPVSNSWFSLVWAVRQLCSKLLMAFSMVSSLTFCLKRNSFSSQFSVVFSKCSTFGFLQRRSLASIDDFLKELPCSCTFEPLNYFCPVFFNDYLFRKKSSNCFFLSGVL